MSWFSKLLPSRIRTDSTNRRSIPEGVWTSCPACKAVIYRAELERNQDVCTKCGHHLRVDARRRIDLFLDAGDREELAADVQPVDFLKFKDRKRYRDRLAEAQRQTGQTDALVTVQGRLEGEPVVVAAFEFEFMGGSMGSVVGEKFVCAVEACLAEGAPLVCFAASGGARMQEGIVSLLQMAKTSAALVELRRRRLPFVSVLTDPTTGGVSASLAMLGDVNVAEPDALIGFAGPRVIEQTVGQVLPEGFQRAEFLLEHGFVDLIIPRPQMRSRIGALLRLLTGTTIPADAGLAAAGEEAPPAEAAPAGEAGEAGESEAPASGEGVTGAAPRGQE